MFAQFPPPRAIPEKKLRHESKFPVFRSYKSSYSYSKILIIQYAKCNFKYFRTKLRNISFQKNKNTRQRELLNYWHFFLFLSYFVLLHTKRR